MLNTVTSPWLQNEENAVRFTKFVFAQLFVIKIQRFTNLSINL